MGDVEDRDAGLAVGPVEQPIDVERLGRTAVFAGWDGAVRGVRIAREEGD